MASPPYKREREKFEKPHNKRVEFDGGFFGLFLSSDPRVSPLPLGWQINKIINRQNMTDDIEIQESISSGMRIYYGLLRIVFIISNAIALSLSINVLCAFLGLAIQRLFYWIGVALLLLFTYPKFHKASPRDKHIMLLVSAIFLVISISLAILIWKSQA